MLAVFAVCIAPLGADAGEGISVVAIENFAFDPPFLEVKVGTRIEFVNRDQVPHSVIGVRQGEEAFRSPEQIDTDEVYSVVMDRPGEVAIGCGLHARISGKIIVAR